MPTSPPDPAENGTSATADDELVWIHLRYPSGREFVLKIPAWACNGFIDLRNERGDQCERITDEEAQRLLDRLRRT